MHLQKSIGPRQPAHSAQSDVGPKLSEFLIFSPFSREIFTSFFIRIPSQIVFMIRQ